jgi:hypothetical protein
VRTRLRNFVTEAHRRFAWFLAGHDVVLLPKLNVSQLVKRYDDEGDRPRCLNAMATRQLLAWGHGRFRSSTLANIMRFQPQCMVLAPTEDYSTKGTVNALPPPATHARTHACMHARTHAPTHAPTHPRCRL